MSALRTNSKITVSYSLGRHKEDSHVLQHGGHSNPSNLLKLSKKKLPSMIVPSDLSSRTFLMCPLCFVQYGHYFDSLFKAKWVMSLLITRKDLCVFGDRQINF